MCIYYNNIDTFENRDEIEGLPENVRTDIHDLIARVDYEDSQRDHSFESLTKEERDEITLFNSFK